MALITQAEFLRRLPRRYYKPFFTQPIWLGFLFSKIRDLFQRLQLDTVNNIYRHPCFKGFALKTGPIQCVIYVG
jgi:hypothetical protein